MTDAALLARRDILDSFLAFAAELNVHRVAVAGHRRRSRPAAEAAGEGGGDADALPEFLLEAPVGVTEVAARDGELAPMAPVDADIILDRLQQFLESDARQFGRRATDFMLAQYREAQYAMVALADDVFLHELDWPGREQWREALLEQRIFNSRLAGDRIFERIDRLLAAGDRRLLQLAAVYLCILSLGFRGRHRGPGGEAAVRGYAQRLFELLSGREPELLGDFVTTTRPLVPAAYAHTVVGDISRRRRVHPRWPAIVAAVVVGWLLVGQGVWMLTSSPTAEAADSVIRAAGESR
ncbi:DotU family type IV/VI secretion system protein [Caenispirillum bisanense]|uniref:Type VI secretion system protein ImpK n=1 Tax=Caenispirillum bisanense TaxID=414052 RepID=A0A286GYU2_9PROT|nr:DotU family type IV/VI secretion system protein [Caenispirillum bisanense]SOE00376.1 type VI secretion system protein ImpK [Caenispirillum bisanense]